MSITFSQYSPEEKVAVLDHARRSSQPLLGEERPHPLGGPPSKGPNTIDCCHEGLHSTGTTADNPYPPARWLPHRFWELGRQARDKIFPPTP